MYTGREEGCWRRGFGASSRTVEQHEGVDARRFPLGTRRVGGRKASRKASGSLSGRLAGRRSRKLLIRLPGLLYGMFPYQLCSL